jgi:predicted CopG family antitoxin
VIGKMAKEIEKTTKTYYVVITSPFVEKLEEFKKTGFSYCEVIAGATEELLKKDNKEIADFLITRRMRLLQEDAEKIKREMRY